MHGRNEVVSYVLYHVKDQAIGEIIDCHVQLLDHVVSMPPANQAVGAGVDLHKYQRHGTSCVEGAGANIILVESDLWAIGMDDRAYGSSDFFAAYYVLLTFFKDFRKGGVTGGVVVAIFSNRICNAAT